MDCLRAIFIESNHSHFIKAKEQTRPLPVPCMEQCRGSLDCGVIVCNNMENETLQKYNHPKIFTQQAVTQYRIKMIEWFMDQDNIEM